jgi:hypothetical protein
MSVSMADLDPQYEVGYGKPPRQTRFQRGSSGNPKGRPKGSKNLATVVLKESRQQVRVNGPRGSRKVTKLEAAVMQLGNKSAQGDLRASREFFALIHRSEETAAMGTGSGPINELDQQMMESLKRRFASLSSTDKPMKTEESK